ncbi:hypothetical protein E4S40_14465 [Algoriphagus kandeliae]|uniref:Uncharacterized protein n=1 Tax=Algoriphagus kandeliae TaxID=2562278 RepID=A0A4Y9QMJ5_9BACT|nr:hypothetical protein [Algoriphagus kandeliae]TFV93450.1 hypothetical protein E4S40_14465 [Algoriphagus kandeliae]
MYFASIQDVILFSLALLVLVGFGFLHFFLFREYAQQKKKQERRLKELEQLVQVEITRSKEINTSSLLLENVKSRANEQLELIRLQIKSLDKNSNS